MSQRTKGREDQGDILDVGLRLWENGIKEAEMDGFGKKFQECSLKVMNYSTSKGREWVADDSRKNELNGQTHAYH